MRFPLPALLAVALLGCGGGGSAPGPDAGAAAADAAAADAAAVDAAASDAGPSLGRLCATTAADGGPGSCADSICCTAGGTTICTLPSDCPSGEGYVSCAHATDCQGAICCALPAMVFCTKPSACAAYGGTEVP